MPKPTLAEKKTLNDAFHEIDKIYLILESIEKTQEKILKSLEGQNPENGLEQMGKMMEMIKTLKG